MGWLAEAASSLLLFALVFGMSATVEVDNLRKQLRNKNALLTGIFLQFVVLPFLGFAVVKTLGMSSPMGITLLVVTSSPGGSYSNWWCSMFNADLALSVTMTAISTFMSIIMLPVNLVIYATSSYSGAVVKSLDWGALFVSLIVVISAILLGLYCSYRIKSYKFNLFANKLGNIAGVALVAFSAYISSSDQDAELWGRDWKFYLGVAAPCVLGLVIANMITSFFNLAHPERVSVSVECCYQNVGIATSVAITMFDGDALAEAIGVPLYYGLVEAVVLGIYCIGAWKSGWTKAPKNERFCVVIVTSYEVEDAELHDPNAIEVVLGMPKEDGLPEDLIFYQDETEGYTIDSHSLESASNPPTPDQSSHSTSLPPLEREEGKEEVTEDENVLHSVDIEEAISPHPPPNIRASEGTLTTQQNTIKSTNLVTNGQNYTGVNQPSSTSVGGSPAPSLIPDGTKSSITEDAISNGHSRQLQRNDNLRLVKSEEGKVSALCSDSIRLTNSDEIPSYDSRMEDPKSHIPESGRIGRPKVPLPGLPRSRKAKGYEKATTCDDDDGDDDDNEPDLFDNESSSRGAEPAKKAPYDILPASSSDVCDQDASNVQSKKEEKTKAAEAMD